MRFFITKLSFLFILVSLFVFAGCKGPEAEVSGFWKSTTAQPEEIIEIGHDYFVSYSAPTTFGRANKEGETVKVTFEKVGEEIQGLHPSFSTPKIAIKDIDGDEAHFKISTLKNKFVRISEDEAKNIISSWPDKIEYQPRALP